MPYADPAMKRKNAREWYRANKKRLDAERHQWALDHPEKWGEYDRKWKASHVEALRAQRILFIAIRAGRIIRPDTCSCGNPNPEGHHEDYSKPLKVDWLCLKYHKKLHQKRRDSQWNRMQPTA